MRDIKQSTPAASPRAGARPLAVPGSRRPRPAPVPGQRPPRAVPRGREIPRRAEAGPTQKQGPHSRRQLQKFIRTPKGYLLLTLLVLLVVTAPNQGMRALELTGLAALMAAATDMTLNLVLREKLVVPTSALLTGLIVGMVMASQEPAWTVGLTAGVAIGAKHLLRTTKAHVFNPAALALVLAPPLLGSGESWWGASAGLPSVAILPLLVTGYLVADRANKLPQVLTFLGVYFALLTGMTYLTTAEAMRIAAMYRDPFLNSVLFFAFFMLTDPPTSPARPRDQIVFGAGVALLAVVIELNHDTITYLLLALLAGNACWAWRRVATTR